MIEERREKEHCPHHKEKGYHFLVRDDNMIICLECGILHPARREEDKELPIYQKESW